MAVGKGAACCLNGAESKWVGVPSGVLQGSVLGLVLFHIYINGIDHAANTIVKKRLQRSRNSMSGCGQKNRRFQCRIHLKVC